MRKIAKSYNEMVEQTGEVKQRAKLVKSKRGWLKVAMGTVVTSAAVLSFGMVNPVSADDAPAQPNQTAQAAGNDTLASETGNYTTPWYQNVRDNAGLDSNVTGGADGGKTISYNGAQVKDNFKWLHYNENNQDNWIADINGQTANNTPNNSGDLLRNVEGTQTGVDVASYQDSDVSKYVQDGSQFVSVKLTEGTNYENPNAGAQIQSAKDNNKTVAAYSYNHYGADVNQAQNEANYSIQKANELGVPTGSYLASDYETAGEVSGDVQQNTNAVISYMDTVKNAGYQPLLYTNSNFFDAHLDNQAINNAHPDSLWIASYTADGKDYISAMPNQQGLLIWQYTSNRDGMNVDANVSLRPLNQPAQTQQPNEQPAQPSEQPAQPEQHNEPAANNDNHISGEYTTTWVQNVRDNASLSAGVTGELEPGYTIKYDGAKEADGYTWLHYQGFSGQDLWIADVNGTPVQTPSAPAQQPAPSNEPAADNGDTTNDSGEYTMGWTQNVRDNAGLNSGVTGELEPGYTVRFNGTKQVDGYTWLRYKNFAGLDRWVAKLN
ncbi:GH25 family lysozyme [Fructilactobacillus vespulae]|uniref:GH25 family lysozyme n=1 Tax=Fructilactobacillus vespulae TaxID=1249630 RepID=UPI0039B6DA46